jgi:hypothetical protein
MPKRRCISLAIVLLLCEVASFAVEPESSRSCQDDTEPPRAAQTSGQSKAASGSPHRIKLTWDASASPAKQVAGYSIFRRESGPNCESRKSNCQRLNPVVVIQGTSCTDYSVQPGHTYIYEVQTVGTNAASRGFSNEAKATAR